MRLSGMSDNKNETGKNDRARVATGEDYEVQSFIEAIQEQRPGTSSTTIRAALDAARADSGSSSREVLTQKVLSIIAKRSQ